MYFTYYFLDVAEEVIWKYPFKVNVYRDKDRNYEPYEALQIMKNFDHEFENRYELTYELSSEYGALTENGMKDLVQQLTKKMNDNTFFGLYICEPYTFLVGFLDQTLFLLDTHPVSDSFGGVKTGVIVVPSNSTVLYLCRWLWKRLYESGIKEDCRHTLSFLQDKKRYFI